MHTAAAWIPNLAWAAIAAIAWTWAAGPGPAAEPREPLRSIEGMIDRMHAVAGECTITTRPGGGTTVVAAAPAVGGGLSCRTGAEWAGNGPMT